MGEEKSQQPFSQISPISIPNQKETMNVTNPVTKEECVQSSSQKHPTIIQKDTATLLPKQNDPQPSLQSSPTTIVSPKGNTNAITPLATEKNIPQSSAQP